MPRLESKDLRARIISNPASGGSRDQVSARRAAVGVLAEHGWTIDWRTTRKRGDATHLAREAADMGCDVVVVAGGDGTVHEAVNGLVGTDTALAVLPTGTANVLAAQLGLVGVPTSLHRANLPAVAEELAHGAARPVDLGWAQPRGGDARYFLLWAGVGLDAAVAREIETEARDLKRLLGPAAFGAVGLRRTALGEGGVEAIIRLDDQRIRDHLLLAVVSNISLYAGAIQLAPEARLDDGALNVALFRGQNILRALQSYFGGDVRSVMQHLSALLTGRADDSRPVTAPVRSVRVIARDALPVHLDGEPFCETPVTIGVRPLGLQLWVPPTAPDLLFGATRSDDITTEAAAQLPSDPASSETGGR
jgi:YegS/Rv2252/BmrU family lipid kinase